MARKKAVAEVGTRGLKPAEVPVQLPPELVGLAAQIEQDGGRVLCAYRDPWGGHMQLLAALPLDRVDPTPFQRDLSSAHVSRLALVIEKLDRFLDPIIAVRTDDGRYWTPNGYHRTAAMKQLGASSIVAIVLPERDIAYQILALNTEKAHNLKEKSLEVIRMARDLAHLDPRPEIEFSLQFEEAPFLTLGICYEQHARFSGGAYHSLLKRIDQFLELPLPEALELRERRAEKLLKLDEKVSEIVQALRDQGIESPYLKTYVVARLSPLPARRRTTADYDETIDAMLKAAAQFDPAHVRLEDLVGLAAGGSEE